MDLAPLSDPDLVAPTLASTLGVEIAQSMVVGIRTAETYVTRILNKLGFDTRVQIATWAKDKGL